MTAHTTNEISVRERIVTFNDPLLVTGAGGFIGSRVVEQLLRLGFRDLRCFVRPTTSRAQLGQIVSRFPEARVDIVEGNLLSRRDCEVAARNVRVVYHVAAGIEKSFAGCFLNSVVSTRNLLEAVGQTPGVRRFVNVSSLAVYSNFHLRRHASLDETCAVETNCVARHEAYTYAKLKQDEIVMEYSEQLGIPYVIVRPGAVYGPGNPQLTARVGIDTFGVFLHLGGRNQIPLTFVDNCASAIALAGIVKGVDREVFNVVDDDLPSSKAFLRAYERTVGRLPHISVPYRIFYLFCRLWETYSRRSGGQLPPAFNRYRCAAYWKGNRYSNQKLKQMLGWKPTVPFKDAASTYFDYLRRLRSSPC